MSDVENLFLNFLIYTLTGNISYMIADVVNKEQTYAEFRECAQPKVSVVILNHNYAEYVETAIKSVLSQTYKFVELIIIDDGSTDNSREIINKYSQQAIVHFQSNVGVVASRNLALSLATGRYIVQLDADDYLELDYIEKMVNAAQSNSADIVYCQAQYFGRVSFITQNPTYSLDTLKLHNYISSCSMFSLDFIQSNHIEYDAYLDKIGDEDWDFPLHCCLAGAKAVLLDEALFFYRKHDDSQSRGDLLNQSLFQQLLVRHHILQRYNSLYPAEFRDYSDYIILLEQMIHYIERTNNLSSELQTLQEKYIALTGEIGKIRSTFIGKLLYKIALFVSCLLKR